MRAAIFDRYGGPEVVRVEDVPVPEPQPGEVLVRVVASAVNHLDLWVRRGIGIETTMPHIGGSDVAGVVADTAAVRDAPEQSAAQPGARVVVNPSLWCGECEWCLRGEQPLCLRYRILGEHTNGGFAEYVAVPARNLLRVPDGYPLEQAAAAALAYLTAWRGLVTRARLQPGETVLVTGASGGVATAAIQIARHVGARVYAVTSGARQVERVEELGADVVYDRTEVDFSRELWRDTGKRGADVVIDSVGSATWEGALRSLARLGRLVIYGATTGPQVRLDLRQLFWKQFEILGTTMATQAEFEEVMDLVFAGRLVPVIDQVLPLEQARIAHDRLEAGGVFGKIVLRP